MGVGSWETALSAGCAISPAGGRRANVFVNGVACRRQNEKKSWRGQGFLAGCRYVTEHALYVCMFDSLCECNVDTYLTSSSCGDSESLPNHRGWNRLSSPRPFGILRVQAASDRPVRTIEYPPATGVRDSHSTLLPELWKKPIRTRTHDLFGKIEVVLKF